MEIQKVGKTLHNKLCITADIWLPAHCNSSQFVLPGNHTASCTEPPSGLLVGAVVFQRLSAVRNDTRSEGASFFGEHFGDDILRRQ